MTVLSRYLIIVFSAFFLPRCDLADNKARLPWSPGFKTDFSQEAELTGPEAMRLPADWVTVGKGGMVAAANNLASQAGVEILKAGGNAADAALAVQWVLNVVEPQSSGIGGGGFLLYYDAEEQKVYAYDGREEAPASAGSDLFLKENGEPVSFYPDRITGGTAVGVPGTVAMMNALFKKHGSEKISLAQTFRRAIELAEGFRISPRLSIAVRTNEKRLKMTGSEATFMPSGRVPVPGEVIRQRELKKTLLHLAENGLESFYKGPIAEDIAAAVQNSPFRPGGMTVEDLRNYRVIEKKPVSLEYAGMRVYTMPPPSSGLILLETLGILKQFKPQQRALNSVTGLHLKLEAEKLAFADRAAYIADPDFTYDDVTGLIDPAYLQKRAQQISLKRALKAPVDAGSLRGLSVQAQKEYKEGRNTTHFVVIDKRGNAVSCTSTIEHGMGSAIVVKGRGFLLNNELTDFDPRPGGLNSPVAERRIRRSALNAEARETKGGKRPRSSMSPVIVLQNKRVRYLLGSPGGPRIPGVNLSVFLRLVHEDLNVQQAVNAARLLQRNREKSEAEVKLFNNRELLQGLREKGHRFAAPGRFNTVFGGVQAIEAGNGFLYGAADTRREGSAVALEPVFAESFAD